MMFACWVNRHQLDVIEYLQEENCAAAVVSAVSSRRWTYRSCSKVVAQLNHTAAKFNHFKECRSPGDKGHEYFVNNDQYTVEPRSGPIQ
jgi:hypothetical protein